MRNMSHDILNPASSRAYCLSTDYSALILHNICDVALGSPLFLHELSIVLRHQKSKSEALIL